MSVDGASDSRHVELLESPWQSPENILTPSAEPTILLGKSRVCFSDQGSCCDVLSLVCFVLPRGGRTGRGFRGKPGLVMQILILLATVALSLATALLTASGILTVLLKVMVRLR